MENWRIKLLQSFYWGGNLAGFISSPFFAIYGTTKMALKIFIKSVNVELQKGGSKNVILNVSPGTIKVLCFMGKQMVLMPCMI